MHGCKIHLLEYFVMKSQSLIRIQIKLFLVCFAQVMVTWKLS